MTDEELKAHEDQHAEAWHSKRINVGDSMAWQALATEVRQLMSELASERAKSAGLQKRCEQLKADAFDGFDRLARERDDALRELRKLQAKTLPPQPVSPNVPSDGEVN